MAASFVVLWPLGLLTVESALIAPAAATALVLAIGMGRAIRRIGTGPLAPRLGLESLWFGIRGQGATLASHVTARLDVAMLPAFVAAAGVGLYSVATNVSLIVYQLASTFAALVLPAAAADSRRGPAKVLGSFWAATAVAVAGALVLALLAEPLLGFVYGDRFEGAAESLPPPPARCGALRRRVDPGRRPVRGREALHGHGPSAAGHGSDGGGPVDLPPQRRGQRRGTRVHGVLHRRVRGHAGGLQAGHGHRLARAPRPGARTEGPRRGSAQ